MKNIRVFLSENFQFLEVKFSVYLNRRVFVMCKSSKSDLTTRYLPLDFKAFNLFITKTYLYNLDPP